MKFSIIPLIVLLLNILCASNASAQGKITRRTLQQSHTGKPQKSIPKAIVSEPDGYIDGFGYVDLGLPSGTKWATCNVGADSPTKFGHYFAWGGIKNKISSKLYDVFVESIAHNPQYDAATFNWGSNWLLPARIDFQELIDNCTSEIVNFNGRTG